MVTMMLMMMLKRNHTAPPGDSMRTDIEGSVGAQAKTAIEKTKIETAAASSSAAASASAGRAAPSRPAGPARDWSPIRLPF
eukprot:2499200-Pyramimonas_sp.AAC.1